MTWVWDHSRTKNGARLVMLGIADCAAGDGTNAWPSMPELVRKTNLSKRAVQDGVRECERLGELKVELNAGPGGTNRYSILMRTPAESAPPQNPHPANPAPVQNLHPSANPQVNPGTPAESAPGAESAPPQNLHGTPAESAPGTVLEPSEKEDNSLISLADVRAAKAPTKPKGPPPGSDDDPYFAAFWAAYPKKKSKGDARRAWTNALKRGVSPAHIVAAAQSFRHERDGEDPQFTPLPASWLNKERYDDVADPTYTPRPDAGDPRFRGGPRALDTTQQDYTNGQVNI